MIHDSGLMTLIPHSPVDTCGSTTSSIPTISSSSSCSLPSGSSSSTQTGDRARASSREEELFLFFTLSTMEPLLPVEEDRRRLPLPLPLPLDLSAWGGWGSGAEPRRVDWDVLPVVSSIPSPASALGTTPVSFPVTVPVPVGVTFCASTPALSVGKRRDGAVNEGD
jgi:hypothetical protein